jgi:hypothetical protein
MITPRRAWAMLGKTSTKHAMLAPRRTRALPIDMGSIVSKRGLDFMRACR